MRWKGDIGQGRVHRKIHWPSLINSFWISSITSMISLKSSSDEIYGMSKTKISTNARYTIHLQWEENQDIKAPHLLKQTGYIVANQKRERCSSLSAGRPILVPLLPALNCCFLIGSRQLAGNDPPILISSLEVFANISLQKNWIHFTVNNIAS